MAVIPNTVMAESVRSPRAAVRIDPAGTTGAKTVEFTGVFRGRELTRKDRRLSSALPSIDAILGGGIVRGRISEIIGRPSAGMTSLAASFMASATRRGEAAAWIDSADAFDPQSMELAGVDLSRVLWTSVRSPAAPVPPVMDPHLDPLPTRARGRERAARAWNAANGSESQPACGTVAPPAWNAAETVLAAGGFGLVVVDLGDCARALPQSAALRMARAAERSGTAVLILSARRMCGTFAALSLVLRRNRACFSRPKREAPVLFDGFAVEAMVARNKLGDLGHAAVWYARLDGADAGYGSQQGYGSAGSVARRARNRG
jgi:hypothetical protein